MRVRPCLADRWHPFSGGTIVAPRDLQSGAPSRRVAEGVGPSTALRKWFNHDPEKWEEFRRRYFRELGSHPEVWHPIASAARRGRVTLVYSSHDTQHNNAVALQEFLRTKRGGGRGPSGRSRRTSGGDRGGDSRHGAPSRRTYVCVEANSAISPRSYGLELRRSRVHPVEGCRH